jgi:hypothetical protein
MSIERLLKIRAVAITHDIFGKRTVELEIDDFLYLLACAFGDSGPPPPDFWLPEILPRHERGITPKGAVNDG